MKDIQLVMSDIDGTILADDHQLDNELKATLNMLQEQQVSFVLASARSPKGMYAIAEALKIKKQPLVCYNGALILENADEQDYSPIFSHELEKAEVQKMLDILENNFPEITINLYAAKDWYIKEYNDWTELEAGITKETPIKTNLKELIASSTRPIHKLLLIGETAAIQSCYEYLENMELETSAFYLSKENYLEITHQEVSKEKALTELAEHFGLSFDNILAMGDNFNDIPMLSLAGIGVAMENAPAAVQKSADKITASNNKNGASQALKKICAKEKRW